MKVLYYKSGDVCCGVDSAVLRQSEPLFVPEPMTDWTSAVVPGVVISRLGMNIKPSKAAEYYKSLTLYHVLRPLVRQPLPWAVCDRAFSPGISIDKAMAGDQICISVSIDNISGDNIVGKSSAFDVSELDIDNVISMMSRYMTFKTGDVILFDDKNISLGTPQLNTELRASINNNELLYFRFK